MENAFYQNFQERVKTAPLSLHDQSFCIYFTNGKYYIGATYIPVDKTANLCSDGEWRAFFILMIK
jgi:hypothetical protein